MPMRESARGHASSRRLPRSQTSRFSLFPPDPSPRLCQYCRPHPFFLHPEAIQDRLFSVFRFCGRRSFLANAKASPSCLAAQLLNTAGFARAQRCLSCPDRTVCFARISRSINLLRRDQFSESCRLRPCFFTILSEARSRHCRFSIIFSPSLSAIFCDAQIALVITHFCRKGTELSPALNASRVKAPLLVQVADSEYLYGLQFYTTLKELEKPVEMIIFANEGHIKNQPKHRYEIYQRNLDWFNFWLQGKEDPDPAKREQYERWRAMRDALKRRSP